MVKFKTCTKCDRRLRLANFHKKRGGRDGLRTECRRCTAARGKAWREANKERRAARGKAYREANKERRAASDKAWYEANKERRAATCKAWYEANKERKAASDKAWREANKERHAARGKAWREANKERKAAGCASRRAAKLLRTVAWSCRDAITDVYEGRPGGYHVDHYYPLQGDTVSGLHVVENLVYLEASTNSAKGNKHPDDLSADIRSRIFVPGSPEAALL